MSALFAAFGKKILWRVKDEIWGLVLGLAGIYSQSPHAIAWPIHHAIFPFSLVRLRSSPSSRVEGERRRSFTHYSSPWTSLRACFYLSTRTDRYTLRIHPSFLVHLPTISVCSSCSNLRGDTFPFFFLDNPKDDK